MSGARVRRDAGKRHLFVEHVFSGGDVIGRRIRYADGRGQETGDWYEIVGDVATFGTNIASRFACFGHVEPIAEQAPRPRTVDSMRLLREP